MKTVVVVGSLYDAVVRHVVNELDRRIVDFALVPDINQIELSFEFAGKHVFGYLMAGPRRIALENVGGILLRPGLNSGDLPSADPRHADTQKELILSLNGILGRVRCPVVNRASPVHFGGNAFTNTVLAAALQDSQLSLPSALLASRPDEAIEFYRRRGCRALLGGPHMSPLRFLSGEEGAQALHDETLKACFLQVVPSGRLLRVLVVEGTPFAAACDQESWTSISGSMRSVTMSSGFHQRCHRLAERIELNLFEMLVVLGDRDYVFSVNSYPWLEGWPAPVCRRVTAILTDLLSCESFTCELRRAA